MNKIICISGTNRPNNYTARALRVVTDELTAQGKATEVFDARDLTLAFPGTPATPDAVRFKEAVKSASGVIIATPEYHGSFAAMTKLMIENLGFPSVLSGKPVALVGVAAGRIGAIKSLEQLRSICAHTGAIVLPGAISIAGVQSAFDNEGNCTDPNAEKALKGVATSLISFIETFVCPKYVLEEMVRGDGGSWTVTV